jgi:hypothetical protein
MFENESPMLTSVQAVSPQSFVAYTPFARAEQWLEQQLHKVPVSLPQGWPESIVKAAPWVWLLMLPVRAFALLLLLGSTALGALFGSFAMLGLLLGIGIFVCDALSLPGLFKRTRQGWAFMVYADVLLALDALVSLSFFTLLISLFVLWLAVQVKPQYRN